MPDDDIEAALKRYAAKSKVQASPPVGTPTVDSDIDAALKRYKANPMTKHLAAAQAAAKPPAPAAPQASMRAMTTPERIQEHAYQRGQQEKIDSRLSYDPSDPLGYAQALAQKEGGAKGAARSVAASSIEPGNILLASLFGPAEAAAKSAAFKVGGGKALAAGGDALAATTRGAVAAKKVQRVARVAGGGAGVAIMGKQAKERMDKGDVAGGIAFGALAALAGLAGAHGDAAPKPETPVKAGMRKAVRSTARDIDAITAKRRGWGDEPIVRKGTKADPGVVKAQKSPPVDAPGIRKGVKAGVPVVPAKTPDKSAEKVPEGFEPILDAEGKQVLKNGKPAYRQVARPVAKTPGTANTETAGRIPKENLPDSAQRALKRAEIDRLPRKHNGSDAPLGSGHYDGSEWEKVTVPVKGLKGASWRKYGGLTGEQPSRTTGPVVVDAEGRLIDGHHRLFEAKQRGEETIEAYRQVPPKSKTPEAPKQESAPPTIQGTAKAKAEAPAAPHGTGETSAQKASMAQDLSELFGKEPPPDNAYRGWEEDKANAIAKGHHTYEGASALSAKGKKGFQLSSDETAGIALRANEIKQKLKGLRTAAQGLSGDDLVVNHEAQKLLESEFYHHAEGLKASKGEVARSLASQKMTIDKDYDLVSVKTRARAANDGKPLDPKREAQYEELHSKLEKAEKDLEAARAQHSKDAERIAEADVERATRQLELEDVKTQKRGARVAKQADIAAQIKDRKSKIEAILKKQQMNLGAEQITAILPHVYDIARLGLRSGVNKAGALVDFVHGHLSEFAEVSRREVRDMISGYGRLPKPASAETRMLNDHRTQQRLVSSLEDATRGIEPKKSGRGSYEQSPEVQALTSELKRIKEREGLDAPQRLAESKQAVRRAIEKKRLALERGDPSPVEGKPAPTDKELEGLKSQSAELTKQLQALRDKKPSTPPTEAQRVASAEKALEAKLAKVKQAIADNDPSMLAKRKAATSAKLDRDRAEYKALVGYLRGMQPESLTPPKKFTPSLNMKQKARVASLDKQIAEYERQIKAGVYEKPKPGTPLPKTPEIQAKEAALAKLRAERDALKPDQPSRPMSENSYVKMIEKREAAIRAKIARGDTSPNPPTSRRVLTKREFEAQQKLSGAKLEMERMIASEKKPKVSDYVNAFQRFAILSGVGSLEKIGYASVLRTGSQVVEGVVSDQIARLPVMRDIAAKAPGATPISWKGHVNSFVDAWKNPRDMWEKAVGQIERGPDGKLKRTPGKSVMERAYFEATGKHPEIRPTNKFMEVMELPGQVHGAIKLPAQRTAWEQGMRRRAAFELKAGNDLADPGVQIRVVEGAYNDSLEAIFRGESPVVKIWNGAVNAAKQISEKGDTAGHRMFGTAAKVGMTLEVPIVRIPSNLLSESLLYSPAGLGRAALEVLASKGTKNMTPEQASIVMKATTKGAIGTAISAAVWYSPGIKVSKKSGDLGKDYQKGDMSFFGQRIANNLTHHPAIMAMKTTANMRDAYNNVNEAQGPVGKRHRRSAAQKAGGLASAAYEGVKSTAEEVPFLSDVPKVAGALRGEAGMKAHLGKIGQSFVPVEARKKLWPYEKKQRPVSGKLGNL